jgi:5,10-methylenetetrahydrofolate reductase
VVPLAERSRLGARIAAGEFAVSVELTAPAGTDLTKTKQQVARLLAAGVDIVNIADGPRASARMGNLAVCARLAAETGRRADPARVRPRPQLPRAGRPPARRPRRWGCATW